MGTPYESSQVVTVTDPAVPVAFSFPGRCALDRVAAAAVSSLSADPASESASETGGASDFVFTIYNRVFTSPAFDLAHILNDGEGFCQLMVFGFLPVKAGDPVRVSGASHYNGLHRVTAIQDNLTENYRLLTTSVPYTAAATVAQGTVALDIPTAEWGLYAVDTSPVSRRPSRPCPSSTRTRCPTPTSG